VSVSAAATAVEAATAATMEATATYVATTVVAAAGWCAGMVVIASHRGIATEAAAVIVGVRLGVVAARAGEVALHVAAAVISRPVASVLVEAGTALRKVVAVAAVQAGGREGATIGVFRYVVCPAVASGATVEAANRGVVDIVESAAPADVVVGTVVPVMSTTPVAAVEASSEVAEAVVNAAIVADGWAPITGVPEVAAGSIAPVAGCPEGILVRWENPGAIDPLVALVGPGPVAGCPDIAVAGSNGLRIDGDGRGRVANGDEDSGMSLGRSDHKSTCEDRCAEDGANTMGEFHSVPFAVRPSFCPESTGFRGRRRRFLSTSFCGSGTQYIRHRCSGFVAGK
jgi:hypothetical protein